MPRCSLMSPRPSDKSLKHKCRQGTHFVFSPSTAGTALPKVSPKKREMAANMAAGQKSGGMALSAFLNIANGCSTKCNIFEDYQSHAGQKLLSEKKPFIIGALPTSWFTIPSHQPASSIEVVSSSKNRHIFTSINVNIKSWTQKWRFGSNDFHWFSFSIGWFLGSKS